MDFWDRADQGTGAYTNQICNIDPHYGNALVHLGTITSNMTISLPETVTWYNNATITNGSSCVTDGAKRDREVWPGDMSVALPSIFVSTNDLVSVKNSLDALLALQNATTGMMPYAGYPFSDLGIVSFTYHLYSLIGISYYYQYTGDLEYLRSNWEHFTRGLAWSLSYIDSSGMMNVTSSADWLRVGMGGHVSISVPITSLVSNNPSEHRSKRHPILHSQPRYLTRYSLKRHHIRHLLVQHSCHLENSSKHSPLEHHHKPLHRQRNNHPITTRRQRLGHKSKPNSILLTKHPNIHRPQIKMGTLRRTRPRSRNSTNNIPIHLLIRTRSSLPLLLPVISTPTHPHAMGIHAQRSPHDELNIHRRLRGGWKSALRSLQQRRASLARAWLGDWTY